MMASSVNNSIEQSIVAHVVSCSHCQHTFPTVKHMLDHLDVAKRTDNRTFCTVCIKVFPNSCAYFYHNIICRDRLPRRPRPLQLRTTISSVREQTEEDIDLPDLKVNEPSPSTSDPEQTKELDNVPKPFLCNGCKHNFSTVRNFLNYTQEKTKNNEEVCTECAMVYVNYCTYFINDKMLRGQPPLPPPRRPLTKNPVEVITIEDEDEDSGSCVFLPKIDFNEVYTFNEPSDHKRVKHDNVNDEQATLKAEIELIMILHECDSNIREKKPLKSKQVCPICDKMCDRDTWQLDNIEDIRLHARVHGTVFLKYSQERLYRAIRRKQMEIPIIKIEEEDTTIVEIKD